MGNKVSPKENLDKDIKITKKPWKTPTLEEMKYTETAAGGFVFPDGAMTATDNPS